MRKKGLLVRPIVRRISAVLLLFLAVVVFLPSVSIASAAESVVEKAEALMKAGQAAQAYAMLEPFESQFAGEVRYDYLLGIAGLDSGKPDRATLAFERVLAVSPDFAGARLDMARAYFELGDISRAKAEFETVFKQTPPEVVRVTIRRYLDAIERIENAKQTVITGFAELTIGRDDNINNSTSQTQVVVPALGDLVFTLNATNVKRGDRYGMMAAGVDIAHEIGGGYTLFGGTSGRYRANSSEDSFDFKSGDIRGGVAIRGETTLFRAYVNGERFYLDNAANRNTTALGADLRYGVTRNDFLNLFGQHSRYRYQAQTLSVNDFNQKLIGLGWLRLSQDGRSALSANLFWGREDALNERADGDKRILGLRLGGQLNLRDNLDAFVSIDAQQGDYRQSNTAFQKTRGDNQVDAVMGIIWRIDNAWSLRPQVLYVRNRSNIPIYAYERTDFSIMLRRDFK